MSRLVLLVDDDPLIRELLREMLGLYGFTVAEADGGLDGLAKVEETKPDIIVLDVMMPDMDGFDVCKKLRSQPKTADLPVIMLSARRDPNAVEIGLSAGANRYMFKPVALKDLVSTIKEVLDVPVPNR